MALINVFSQTKRIARRTRLHGESVLTLYGDVEIDLSQSPLEPGYHHVRLVSLGGNIAVCVPEHVGLEVNATTLFTEITLAAADGGEQERLDENWQSENFAWADVRLVLSIYGLYAGIVITRPAVTDLPPHRQLTDPGSAQYRLPAYQGATRKLNRER